LYKKAREGKIANFTGITSPYEEPHNAYISIDTSNVTIEEATNKVIKKLQNIL